MPVWICSSFSLSKTGGRAFAFAAFLGEAWDDEELAPSWCRALGASEVDFSSLLSFSASSVCDCKMFYTRKTNAAMTYGSSVPS